MIVQSRYSAIRLLGRVSVSILACFLAMPAFAQSFAPSPVTLYTEKNVIPEGDSAFTLIRPDSTITDPATITLTLSADQGQVTLSQSRVRLSKAQSRAKVTVSIPDDDKLQTRDIKFTITPRHPHFTFNPPVLAYTIPPNDLALLDYGSITLEEQGQTQDLTLTINQSTGQKSFIVSVSYTHLTLPTILLV